MNGCTNRSKWAIDIPSEASAPVSSRRGTASIDRSRDRLGVGTLVAVHAFKRAARRRGSRWNRRHMTRVAIGEIPSRVSGGSGDIGGALPNPPSSGNSRLALRRREDPLLAKLGALASAGDPPCLRVGAGVDRA